MKKVADEEKNLPLPEGVPAAGRLGLSGDDEFMNNPG